MRKLGKVFSSLLVGLFALAFAVSPAYASTIARNVNVINSWAWVEATEDAEVIVDSFNLAENVGWLVDSTANTGGNDASGGGLIDTGPAGVLTDVATGVNSSGILGAVDLGGQTLAENETISDSWVWAKASKTSYLEVATDNWAIMVGSIISGFANSGENTALGGSSGDGGIIYTGGAGFGAVSQTSANDSFFDVFVDMSGNTTARNADVSGSIAYANASSEVGVGVYTSNLAVTVGNIVNGWADSGSNQASGGDGLDGGDGGYVDTGLALFGSQTSTAVNSSQTLLAVDLGGATKAENIGIDPSYVEANAGSLAEVAVVNANGAFLVGNMVGGFANSGENMANGGQGLVGLGGNGGMILTGDTGSVVLAETVANSNSTEVVGEIGGSTTARNAEVGIGEVYANADSAAGVLVVNDNTALGGNLVFLGANSGMNQANGADGASGGNGGLISTGNTEVIIGSSVSMNDNYTLVAGDFGGNVTAENLMIDLSYAEANASGGTFIEVVNLNNVSAVNSVEVYANTGENEANGGEDGGNGGVIYTGEALLLVEAETAVNNSQSYVAGDFTGNASAENSRVSDSEVYADASSFSGVLVVNDNGDFGGAEVTTSVLAEANTGGNTANGDGDGGLVDTGAAALVADIGTSVNSSTTTVVGAGGGNATAKNSEVSNSSVQALASSTGETAVVNTNSATVETNVETTANTGANDASGGPGYLEGNVSTGTAVNETQVSSTVNTNQTTVVVKQGSATASNTEVSDGSSVTATAESLTATTVANTNNATVVNNVSTSSNTGGNTAVDGGSVSTGGAGTSTSGSTNTNTNTVNLVVNP